MQHRTVLTVVVALLGLLTGALTGAGQLLPILVERTASSTGALAMGLSVVSFAVNPVVLLGVGYWAGTRVDVAAEYGGLLLVLGAVGGVATAVGYLAVVSLAVSGVGAAGSLLFGVGYNAVVQAVNFAVTGFAGAALAQFRGGRGARTSTD